MTENESSADPSALTVAVAALTERLTGLERNTQRIKDELEIRRLLAWYGFYADHDLNDEWAGLFSPDATLDVMMYFGADPNVMDPSLFRQVVYRGREEMVNSVLLSPAHQALIGRSQHHLDGQPAVIDIESDSTATATTYGILFIASATPDRNIEYQNLSVNRWRFVKTDRWYIESCVRRRLDGETTRLLPAARR
jgi:hypothetical protein